jgi:GDPmannose 4,6-dehydratase
MKKALITGITGQDGSIWQSSCWRKDYEVHGIVRRSSFPTTERIDHLIAKNAIKLHDGDLSDSSA